MVGIACCAASAMSCSRRFAKNGSLPTRSAPTRFCTMAVNAVSMSSAVVAGRAKRCSPSARGGLCQPAGCLAAFGVFWFFWRGGDWSIGGTPGTEPQSLGAEFGTEPAHPGDITARPIDAGNKAAFHRVVAAREDDRDCTGRLHGDERRIVASGCGDHGDFTSNEISCERRQPIQLSLRPVIFDRNVLTIQVTGLVQATAESRHLWSERLRRLPIQESDHRHRRLLRARRERPDGYTAAKKCDEFPPPHGGLPQG